MSGSSTDATGRYGVENGTDGSWLVVDYGADRCQRIAISRESSAEAARQEASTLSAMETLTSDLAAPTAGPWDEFEDLAEQACTTIDAEHNFNHLLPPKAAS